MSVNPKPEHLSQNEQDYLIELLEKLSSSSVVIRAEVAAQADTFLRRRGLRWSNVIGQEVVIEGFNCWQDALLFCRENLNGNTWDMDFLASLVHYNNLSPRQRYILGTMVKRARMQARL
jgi:hypothetical protein